MLKRFLTGAIVAASAALMLPLSIAAQGGGQSTETETLSATFRGSRRADTEYNKIAPFKVFDNLYHVGPGSVSAWLIPTTDGLILIDTVQEPFVDYVLNNIRNVGYDRRTSSTSSSRRATWIISAGPRESRSSPVPASRRLRATG